MEIEYKSKKLRELCENSLAAQREYGIKMALKIERRIGQISAYPTVEKMIRDHIGRCHPLEGDRKNQYAVDLVQPYRLVF